MSSFKAGLAVLPKNDSQRDLEIIQELDEAGVQSVWQTAGATRPDAVTLYAAAAATTTSIRFGTSIVPTYPRHPTTLATQALVVESLAPGRLRLGVGPSHRPTIEGSLGIPMGKPLAHLREYVTVLRALLWDGKVDFHGEYFNVTLEHQSGTIPPKTEIPISALSENSYRLAGEIADSAISWVSPIPYLVSTALPALAEGAARGNRAAAPLIAHVPVAVTSDRSAALDATAKQFGDYGQLPFYARMFESAGFPVESDGSAPSGAIDSLAVSGTPDQIRARLEDILAEGIDELLVTHTVVNDADAERKELARILAGG
jgi:alkanesulfonate monooxygenase SsuD/methylene tetrahydromethanopterin reductase-like flavin-dependent oxidoreductase (luciferase family)